MKSTKGSVATEGRLVVAGAAGTGMETSYGVTMEFPSGTMKMPGNQRMVLVALALKVNNMKA